MNLHFQTFRLQPPHAPPSSGNTFCSGRAWPPLRIGLLTAELRTSHIASSLVSRIRPYRVCVATPIGPLFYGLSIHFQLLSTPCRHDAVTFSYWREAPPERDLHPPMHAHFQAHERGLQPASACGLAMAILSEWSAAFTPLQRTKT